MPASHELIVRFRQPIRFALGEEPTVDGESLDEALGAGQWGDVFASFPGLGMRLAKRYPDPEEPEEPRARRRFRRRRRLRSFARVRLPGAADPREWARQLRLRFGDRLESVRVAGEPRRASSTNVPTTSLAEDHLDPAPFGVGAREFWTGVDFGAAGAPRVRVCVCDVSYVEHENVPNVEFVSGPLLASPPGAPAIDEDDLTHGIASLGVVGAVYDERLTGATTGVAWGAGLRFSSRIQLVAGESGVTRAIDRALGDPADPSSAPLQAGDVLLIEWHLLVDSGALFPHWPGDAPTYLPVEWDPDVRDAIEEAADAGIVVIEPAGNGLGLLQPVYETTDSGPELRWDPADDSGAILVGGGRLLNGARIRYAVAGDGSNYGPRVDCHSWADGVTAPAVDVHENPYTHVFTTSDAYRPFGQTSAASAIIAGAAACLQWAHHERLGGTLALPGEIRALFREAGNGTPQTVLAGESPLVHRVGPQPDLTLLNSRIPANALVHQRDSLADLGAPVPAGAPGLLQARSPDVIVTRASEMTDLAERATWDREFLPLAIEDDQARIVLRARNRSAFPVSATASLFRSEPAAFLHPRWWRPNKVADFDFASIVENGVDTADTTFAWEGPPPSGGFQSWVALFDPDGTTPVFPDVDATTEEYLDFLRTHPHLRALSLQHLRVGTGGTARFRFRFRGLPEGPSEQHFAIGTELPDDTGVSIVPDAPLIDATDSSLVVDAGAAWDLSLAEWRDQPRTFQLDKEQEIELLIDITPPATAPGLMYNTTLDQFLGKDHLGRMHLLVEIEPPAIV